MAYAAGAVIPVTSRLLHLSRFDPARWRMVSTGCLTLGTGRRRSYKSEVGNQKSRKRPVAIAEDP